MINEIDAVYEQGVLRPLQPLHLAESQVVRLRIESATDFDALFDTKLTEQIRAEVADMDSIPSLEEVRAALADIPGSLAEMVIAERGEY